MLTECDIKKERFEVFFFVGVDDYLKYTLTIFMATFSFIFGSPIKN